MEPEVITRKVTTQGELTTAMFGLSERNTAHLINILRSSLYTDKELAVLREYCTNAWDAHVEAGISSRPFKVGLPTSVDPNLTVRDYGLGMSEETVYKIFALYGESTKRESNDQIGYMGIGSKSAFCYSDTFTVTSFYGGFKTVYLAVIDESNVGKLSKVYQGPSDETGIEIRVPANTRDIAAFQKAANWLFQFFDPLPQINLEIRQPNIDRQKHGFFVRTSPAGSGRKEPREDQKGSWVAVMGCVPYRLNFSRMLPDLHDLGLEEVVKGGTGGLFFDIGEVSVSASREELEYTERTRTAVVAKLRALFGDFVGSLDEVIDDPNTPDWEKRLAVCTIITGLDLPLVGKYRPWAKLSIQLFEEWQKDGDGNKVGVQPPFKMRGYFRHKSNWGVSTGHSSRGVPVSDVDVTPETRLLIKDKSILRGHNIGPTDRVLSPLPTMTVAELEEVLAVHVKNAGLQGIPIIRLSDLPSQKVPPTPRGKGSAPGNIKHKEQFFVLRTEGLTSGPPLSSNWDVVERVPQEDDVFVVLSHFVPSGSWGPNRYKVSNQGKFYSIVAADRKRFAALGVDFPPIYGVKSTVAKPVSESDVMGVPYKKWREEHYRKVLDNNPEVKAQIVDVRWAALFSGLAGSDWALEVQATLQARLPTDHPLVVVFTRHAQAKTRHRSLPESQRKFIAYMDNWQGNPLPENNLPTEEVRKLIARYPLLGGFKGFQVFRNPEEAPAWWEYVDLKDKALLSETK